MTQRATNAGSDISLRLPILSDRQIEAIHQASLEILGRTGYHVPIREARELLHAAGARVEGERVYIPGELVEQALKSFRPITLYDRSGTPVIDLSEGRVTFGALSDTVHLMDPYQRAVRPFVKDDQRWYANFLDALPNIDWIQCVGQASDVPASLQTQVAFAQCVRNTTKPILAFPYDNAGLLDLIDVAEIVTGSETDRRERPFFCCASVPHAPLRGADFNVELILTCAARGVPLVYYNTPAMGGNSPCSVLATLMLGNADWLAALVIHQLKQPGAPFCCGGFVVQVMDMRSTTWAFSAPEAILTTAAMADLIHWYGIPAFGLEMKYDVFELNAQAGVEYATSCMWAILSGVEMVHNVGNMAGKVIGPEAVVLADEIISYMRPAVRPIPILPDAVEEAISLIDEVGPFGEYISHEHTLKRFRDFWYPTVLDRSRFDPMSEVQGNRLLDRLNDRARQLISTHTVEPLAEDMLGEVDALERTWYARSGS